MTGEPIPGSFAAETAELTERMRTLNEQLLRVWEACRRPAPLPKQRCGASWGGQWTEDGRGIECTAPATHRGWESDFWGEGRRRVYACRAHSQDRTRPELRMYRYRTVTG